MATLLKTLVLALVHTGSTFSNFQAFPTAVLKHLGWNQIHVIASKSERNQVKNLYKSRIYTLVKEPGSRSLNVSHVCHYETVPMLFLNVIDDKELVNCLNLKPSESVLLSLQNNYRYRLK